MPTDNRATAGRIARDEQWNPSDEDLIDRFKQCAFGGVESLREWLIKAQPHDVGRVREELVRFARHLLTWDRLEQRAVARRMAHRDRTAEREAAKKAWDAAAERRYGPGWPVHSSSDKARDAYLAAEFDAGERVTEPKAAPVLTWHDDGFRKQVLADETGRIVGSVDDGNAYLSDRGHIGRYVTPQQACDAVKRLAEQRGAER